MCQKIILPRRSLSSRSCKYIKTQETTPARRFALAGGDKHRIHRGFKFKKLYFSVYSVSYLWLKTIKSFSSCASLPAKAKRQAGRPSWCKIIFQNKVFMVGIIDYE